MNTVCPVRFAEGQRPRGSLTTAFLGMLVVWMLGAAAHAEIVVEGIADRAVVTGAVRPRIIGAANSSDLVRLDGKTIDAPADLEVTQPDYHELEILRSTPAGVLSESRKVRFVIRAEERGNTEWGLPAWVPPAVIPASSEELADGHLRWLIPPAMPAGSPIPVAVWLEGTDGQTLRAHVELKSNAHPTFLLRRGSGSTVLNASPSQVVDGLFSWTTTLPGQSSPQSVRIEERTEWVRVSGTLAGQTSWNDNARVEVTDDLEIPVGSTISIGAGSLIRMAPGVSWKIFGRVEVRGTRDRAVLFTAANPDRPWGGLEVRGTAASVEASGTLWTESGSDASWFDQNSGFSVHRREQALFLIDGGQVVLRDCAAFDGHGQFGHGRNGQLTLERCLIQRFLTGGEFNGGRVDIQNSALIEFPSDDGIFADGDNDAIYLTHGDHVIRDTVIGWARDDGIDAGSGGAGSVTASNVWAEGIFHEAFAWSGQGRRATNLQCVAVHCGQGFECGWSEGADSPRVEVSHCLSLENLSGVRFGDNYDWTYNGFLRVTNSFLLGNHRDVFGMNWDDWTWRSSQMEIRGNRMTRVPGEHPENTGWDPAVDGGRLAAFVNTAASARVGVGFAARGRVSPRDVLSLGTEIGLSRFATNELVVPWVLESSAGTWDTGNVRIPAGRMLARIQDFRAPPDDGQAYRLRLVDSSHAEITGAREHLFLPSSTASAVLVERGSRWRYRDNNEAPPTDWLGGEFDASAWNEGPAELGFGDGDEATQVQGGPTNARFPVTWFRREFEIATPTAWRSLEIRVRRDDGALVYLNGTEVFRSNLPSGPLAPGTYAGQSTSSETEFFSGTIPASALRAGRNVLGVQIHQANATSGDLSFDLELLGIPVPTLSWFRFGAEALLAWDVTSNTLEEGPTPSGPWFRSVLQESPATVEGPTTRFFRLVSH